MAGNSKHSKHTGKNPYRPKYLEVQPEEVLIAEKAISTNPENKTSVLGKASLPYKDQITKFYERYGDHPLVSREKEN